MELRRTRISELLSSTAQDQEVLVKGWVRTKRGNKHVNFIALNDGSSIHSIQIVADPKEIEEAILKSVTTGASLAVQGKLTPSQGGGQAVEIQATHIEIYGEADPEQYPLQPKKHSFEFLRDIAHLRPRTNTFGAIFRIRHAMSYATHEFFNQKGFVYWHSPIITASDAEGAGEMFSVSALDMNKAPRTESGEVDYSQDFFGKPTNLTVSGQLEGELGALALGEIYTFGPTFRAENSNTTRHLAEFWMIEPEMAFYDLKDNMDLAEEYLKYLVKYALDNCQDDLVFLEKRLLDEEKSKPQADRSEFTLRDKLKFVVENNFVRLTYGEAIDILRNSKPNKKKKFQFPIEGWGADLQSEHERYLVEKHFKKPVILVDYPKEIKSFYMRLNDDDKTVGAMDILFPGIGEIVGGSEREERLDVLLARMEEMNVPKEEMDWFLDTRRFGTVPHSGFGLGFERLILFVTGMSNIRDVIPFPRTPGNAAY